MAVDVGKELRRAVDTGKVLFGERESEKSVLKGTCKLVIISNNAEKYAKERIEQLCDSASVPYFEFNATGIDIGSYCGKPFVVSFTAVVDKGKSKLLDVVGKK